MNLNWTICLLFVRQDNNIMFIQLNSITVKIILDQPTARTCFSMSKPTHKPVWCPSGTDYFSLMTSGKRRIRDGEAGNENWPHTRADYEKGGFLTFHSPTFITFKFFYILEQKKGRCVTKSMRLCGRSIKPPKCLIVLQIEFTQHDERIFWIKKPLQSVSHQE